jgi:hypothetical protein
MSTVRIELSSRFKKGMVYIYGVRVCHIKSLSIRLASLKFELAAVT